MPNEEPPTDRERDRWVTLAFCAAVIAGQPANEQRIFMRAALGKFADVPDRNPFGKEPCDLQACAVCAVKMLLESLIADDPAIPQAGKAVRRAFDRLTGLTRDGDKTP
jgi:hypothetical protein